MHFIWATDYYIPWILPFTAGHLRGILHLLHRHLRTTRGRM